MPTYAWLVRALNAKENWMKFPSKIDDSELSESVPPTQKSKWVP